MPPAAARRRTSIVSARSSCLKFLPPPPPTTNAAKPDAAAVFVPPGGSSEDRVSQLPHDIQRAVVSKLPVKDGAATVVLCSSWRSIWPSIPLVLDDAQVRPEGMDELEAEDRGDDDSEVMEAVELSRALVGKKVTAILRSHPGPFRLVRLTSSPASALRAWLRIMAVKGVEELVVLNCEWPTALMFLSVELLRCKSLKRLHLAQAQMPLLTVPARGRRPERRRPVHFPNLQQLVLCHAFVPQGDIADFLAGCPVLEMLSFVEGSGVPRYIEVLRNPRLKCLLLWQFKPLRLTLDAACIERVILRRPKQFFVPPRTRIQVRRAPNLRILGYLDPEVQVLEIGDMVIKAGTRPKADVMLPSVEILAIKIRFGVREDERTLLAYLRVFPNITTLHIQSALAPHPVNEHGSNFWNNDLFSFIPCISKIKKISFYDFHGMDNNSNLSFIKSIAQTSNLLEHMRITISGSIMEPPNLLKTRLMNYMSSEVEWASEASILDIIASNHKEWEYGTASDMSLGDPFEYI